MRDEVIRDSESYIIIEVERERNWLERERERWEERERGERDEKRYKRERSDRGRERQRGRIEKGVKRDREIYEVFDI